ncbi:MAG: hypothetical protein ACJAZ1_001646 [Yoonia sp.]|jgi:hypothetical protein
MPPLKYALVAVCFLAACDQTSGVAPQPDLPADDPGQAVLIEAECAIYFAAVAQLEVEVRAAQGNPTRGCPAEAAGRAADINPMVSVPPVMTGYPQELYQRILARGIPVDMADDIAKSKAFWDLVARRDSLLAGF